MKRQLLEASAVLIFIIAGSFSFAFACTPQQIKDATKVVLSAAQIACILNRVELGNTEAMKLCQIREDLAPVVETLVSEHKAAMSRASKAGACK